MQTLHYCIAGWNIALHMENGLSDNLQLEPYIPFICSEHKADNILFELYAQKTQPNNPAIGTIIGNFQCSNAIFSVYSHAKGCYTFDVYTFSNKSVPCCRIQASTGFYHVKVSLSGDKQLCTFGLNNAMMIAFAFASPIPLRVISSLRLAVLILTAANTDEKNPIKQIQNNTNFFIYSLLYCIDILATIVCMITLDIRIATLNKQRIAFSLCVEFYLIAIFYNNKTTQ